MIVVVWYRRRADLPVNISISIPPVKCLSSLDVLLNVRKEKRRRFDGLCITDQWINHRIALNGFCWMTHRCMKIAGYSVKISSDRWLLSEWLFRAEHGCCDNKRRSLCSIWLDRVLAIRSDLFRRTTTRAKFQLDGYSRESVPKKWFLFCFTVEWQYEYTVHSHLFEVDRWRWNQRLFYLR